MPQRREMLEQWGGNGWDSTLTEAKGRGDGMKNFEGRTEKGSSIWNAKK